MTYAQQVGLYNFANLGIHQMSCCLASQLSCTILLSIKLLEVKNPRLFGKLNPFRVLSTRSALNLEAVLSSSSACNMTRAAPKHQAMNKEEFESFLIRVSHVLKLILRGLQQMVVSG